jgi:hypothetical protein
MRTVDSTQCSAFTESTRSHLRECCGSDGLPFRKQFCSLIPTGAVDNRFIPQGKNQRQVAFHRDMVTKQVAFVMVARCTRRFGLCEARKWKQTNQKAKSRSTSRSVWFQQLFQLHNTVVQTRELNPLIGNGLSLLCVEVLQDKSNV